MNYRGLKQAARQCLHDCEGHPRRLTLLFLLCLLGVSLGMDLITYLLELQLTRTSGSSFDAAGLRARADLWTVLSSLCFFVVQMLWSAGYRAFALQLSRRKPVAFRTFTVGFRMIGRVLAVQLLQLLYISLWSMLLVVPGLVAAYRYRMALFIVLDNPDVSASEALAISSRLTYGHKAELVLLDLSFLWYYLPGFLCSMLVTSYNYGLLPAVAYTEAGYWATYLINLLLPMAMDVLALAYVETTNAHAYNWLLTLDRARREEARGYHMPGGY